MSNHDEGTLSPEEAAYRNAVNKHIARIAGGFGLDDRTEFIEELKAGE